MRYLIIKKGVIFILDIVIKILIFGFIYEEIWYELEFDIEIKSIGLDIWYFNLFDFEESLINVFEGFYIELLKIIMNDELGYSDVLEFFGFFRLFCWIFNISFNFWYI